MTAAPDDTTSIRGLFEIDAPRVYSESDDKKLYCNIFRPVNQGPGPFPGVVLVHGGGWFGGMRQQLRWYGRHFAARGYVAMAIDYRRMFRWAFPHCVHDCKAAVRWLRLNADDLRLDADRILALGNSAGGHLSCMLAVTRPEHGLEGTANLGPSSAIQAAVSLYGPQELTYYLAPDWPLKVAGPIPPWYIRHFVERDHGVVDDPFEAASPITYADEHSPPIMFVHGTRDILSPFEQSVKFHEKLKDLGVPTELVAVEGRNHAFDFIFAKERARCFERICAFLDQHLTAPESVERVSA